MSDGPREIGRVPYVPGFVPGGGAISRPLIVGVEDGAVTIGTPGGTLWRLDVDARELFMRLFQQAEFAVEGEGGHVFRVPEQAEVAGDGPGCGLASCVNGPAGHFWHPSCRILTGAAGVFP